jgi:hypothetical protein
MSAGARGAASEGPHPLAVRLAAALPRGARVLVAGPGRGRSLPPLEDAGLSLTIVTAGDEELRDASGTFDGALSTHALLHGTPAAVARRIAALAERLAPHGLLHATFGSCNDARYAAGIVYADGSWTPAAGSERGVVHASFDAAGLRALLHGFDVERAEEIAVAEIAGTWAHGADDAAPSVHWFVEARRRP